MTTSAIAIQNQCGPGSTVQPATSIARSRGVTRLRRRLSRIFQRPMSGSEFRLMPWRDGTNGNSQKRICQSPRIQRCCRRACASTLEGYSSTNSTSDTRATRAWSPSNRSWDSSEFSGTQSSREATKASTS